MVVFSHSSRAGDGAKSLAVKHLKFGLERALSTARRVFEAWRRGHGGRRMKNTRLHPVVRQTLGVVCVLLLSVFPAGVLLAQQAPAAAPAQPSPPAQPLSPDQLDTLVAPVALYPDALLSQVLVAATYPLEVVEESQWLQQNRNLQGQQLMDAARQQNWDPSIQALAAFPDVVNRLNSDIRWTTDLGNAFLAQQADVTNAVQRMRAQAKAGGKRTPTLSRPSRPRRKGIRVQ